MKKTYIIPCTTVMQAEVEQILANSVRGTIDDDIEIGFGGIDEDGDIDPSVKEKKGSIDWDGWDDF